MNFMHRDEEVLPLLILAPPPLWLPCWLSLCTGCLS